MTGTDRLAAALADTTADRRLERRLLAFLQRSPSGATSTAIGARFAHEAGVEDRRTALGELQRAGLARVQLRSRGGRGLRQVEVWHAVSEVDHAQAE